MPSLKGTETEQNLKDAFAGESQANCRYLYFAQKADVEGFNVVADCNLVRGHQIDEICTELVRLREKYGPGIV